MSRRKQAHPRHIDTIQELTNLLENGLNSGLKSDIAGKDEHVCGKCRAEFGDLGDFISHKRYCTRKRPVFLLSDEVYDELCPGKDSPIPRIASYLELVEEGILETVQTDDKPESPESEYTSMPSLVMKRKQSFGEEAPVDDPSSNLYRKNLKRNTSLLSSLPQFPFGQLSDTNVTLEALENTRVAVAQYGTDATQLSHITALQSALYALQQQQLVQIQVIQQLQTQLIGSSSTSIPSTTTPLTGSAALTPPQCGENTTVAVTTSTTSRTLGSSNGLVNTTSNTSKTGDNLTDASHPLAPPPPLPHEPNTLELLQRHTEQALQNTMSGGSFLLNGLSSSTDISRYCKGKDSEGKRDGTDEAFFRHRCRFCGKLFGSDSALQIHIRSHTGERPFKCNVCGNRFSTKGNLKVHFQRHASKYPHIKMNPNPVPEHLDSLHPPLEPPDDRNKDAPDFDPLQSNIPSSIAGSQGHELEYKLGNGSPDDVTSQDLGSPIQTTSLSPNEASNMSDASDASADGSGMEDNMDKDSEFLKGDEDDQRSFTSTPKGVDDRKDDDARSDDERKPLTGIDNNSNVPSSLLPAFINTSTPTFPSFLNPTSFSPICFPSVPTTPTITTTASGTNNDNMGIHADPAFYQNLLPKPGSNDNSWESLMEITKTSETSKLQQLVDNIEHKLSDPNQCVICHRVLSCKSALQMHYRTHTGERPFKCKICGRAFTTKGNLKTHMGVHRVKPPMRVLHQCPVCHKQFTNSLVLQQHIRTHTGEPTDMLPEHIIANEIKSQSLLQASFPRPIMSSMSHHQTSPVSMATTIPIGTNMQSNKGMDSQISDGSPSPVMTNDSVIKTTSSTKDNKSEDSESSNGETPPVTAAEDSPPITTVMPTLTRSISPASDRVIPASDRVITTSSNFHSPYTASLVALENHVKAINSTIPQPLPFSPFGLGLHMGSFLRYDDPSNYMNRTLPKDGNRDKSPPPSNAYSPSPSTSRAGSEGSGDDRSTPGSLRKADSPSSVNLSQPVVTSSQSENGALDLTPRTSILSKPITSTAEIAMFSPLSGLPFPPPGNRPNTTCKVCFKTFACNSALEIHYRSHTKERPFKCTVCDRGFSTKGNMKQHMLTHKIRDLPSQLFSTEDNNSSTSAPTTPILTNTTTDSGTRPQKEMTPPKEVQSPTTPSPSPKKPLSEGNTILPAPKRPPGMPKHMCNICNKPFSSASALQIHMRTHTGDKPFKCTICGRAFTTKGNLKVHMGTHMWNNCSSRRGRRMSLELPGLPITPGKPGDIPPPRPDMYFPYLPPTYVNGMNAPKMNEISVIQTAGVTNGNVVSSMNMSPAVSMAGEDQSKSDHENRQSPISRPNDLTSAHRQESPPASWSWKIACNICNKICCSSTELELHVQCHYQPEGAKDEGKCISGERIST
ncbi:sal-like protein 1 [Centruroides sculpturatus]|uniref:sal-like protein 1 n=1 Tax=Centruroides sculpturatus TaxID=218467 RepID=UPI000C6D1555|nr:sal-like protein 1 [Centruroides sculpturatus]XP_023219874.1 sal-like protein 1 [Centruroides sculpturatus]